MLSALLECSCLSKQKSVPEVTNNSTCGKARPSSAPAPIHGETSMPKPRLLQDYVLGSIIGQGAFGVVYQCQHRQTHEKFAVKMVDQVETPLPEIKREVEMLLKLAHPTVMKIVDTYYEKVFVCMVLDLYSGGDMMKGMSRHWSSKGMVPMPAVQLRARQMWRGIAWIHLNNCAHRDVKGDNFMMDRLEVEDPDNRIYLADFGTVMEVVPGSRLKYRCGTKQYWSPEFFRLDYGLSVDCWATGVIMFGLFTGKFPFKNENEVKNKEMAYPKRVPKSGVDFMSHVFERSEEKRFAARVALEHPFLSEGMVQPSQSMHSTESSAGTPDMCENGANVGIKNRRAELVDRLQRANEPASREAFVFDPAMAEYAVEDPNTKRAITYAWLDVESSAMKDLSSKELAVNRVNTSVSAHIQSVDLTKTLKDHGITVDSFGQGRAKTFKEYLQELQDGRSKLMIDATQYKSLVRAVDIVLLRVELITGDGTSSSFLMCRGDEGKVWLPAMAKRPHETTRQCTERLRIGMGLGDVQMEFDYNATERTDQDEPSASYPNLRTVYRKEIVPCRLVESTPEALKRLGVHTKDGTAFEANVEGRNLSFTWLAKDQCLSDGVQLYAPAANSDFSALVYPPVGYQEEELNEYLIAGGIPLSEWGTGNNKSLSEFSEELTKGESVLAKKADGAIVREVIVVILKIHRADRGEMIMESGETFQSETIRRIRLPAVKKLNGEHPFWAARRLVTSFLKMPSDMVQIDPESIVTSDELQDSASYVGVQTLYRKFTMTAEFLA